MSMPECAEQSLYNPVGEKTGLITGMAQHIVYVFKFYRKNIAHPKVRYGKLKRSTYARGTRTYRCSQSIS